MNPRDYPIITLEPSPDGKGKVICVRYLIDHSEAPPRMMAGEQKWILSSFVGHISLETIFGTEGRKKTINGGVYEYVTPEEKALVRARRFHELARLRPFKPTLPIHFEVLGLEVPDKDHEWVLQEKRMKT